MSIDDSIPSDAPALSGDGEIGALRRTHAFALSMGLGIGTWDWDIVADRVRADSRFARLYGVPIDVARDGAPIEQFFRRIHPDDRPAVETAIAVAMRTGGVFAEEYRLIDEAGVIEWVLARGQCEFADDGTPLRFPGISFDITARKNAEARQACLLTLTDRLHDVTDPDAITYIASEVLGTALGLSRAGYGIVGSDDETVHIENAWHHPAVVPVVSPIRLRDYGDHVDDLRRGESVVIGDVAFDPRTRGHVAGLNAIHARAFVNMPMIEHGRFVALLFVTSDRPRSWSGHDIALIREVGDRLRSATERARSERALRTSEQDLRLALVAGRFGTWKLDLASGVFESSPMCRIAYGRDPNLPMTYDEVRESVHPDDRLRRQRMHEITTTTGRDYDIEYRIETPAGDLRWLAVRAQIVTTDDRPARVLTGVTTDITERKVIDEALGALNVELERRVEERTRELVEAQEALRQSQKMEAVGQLTGGIAHDFNNLLQGITGSLQIMRRRIGDGRTNDLDRFMDGAITSASRAAALTHRLLAFSRRQPLDPRPVQANALIASLEDLFRRSIGEAIDLVIVAAPDLWDTLCDPNQLESSLLNLVLNARDAMPAGGTLRIETCNVSVETDHDAKAHDLRRGEYVRITVADTGAGMSPETIAKAFDPFFTTKPLGHGTGLGLSMVHGFAGQSEGSVEIESVLGAGATLNLYLPRLVGDAEPAAVIAGPVAAEAVGNGETVLVVEDEAVVRALIVAVLTDLGYAAIEAADGRAGLDILQSERRIDLLVTDIGLPGLNGREVADAARLVRPDLKVLFMTGYAESAALATGFLDARMAMVTKPFDVDTLAQRISAMIEHV